MSSICQYCGQELKTTGDICTNPRRKINMEIFGIPEHFGYIHKRSHTFRKAGE